MAVPITIRRLLAVLTLLSCLLPALSHAYADLVVLGDSLSDVGNLRLATQGLPGGPLPQDPPYFQGRFSDGPNYTETLWRRLGLPGDIKPSFAGGTNYAVGGARTRYHDFDLANPAFNPLTDATTVSQLTLFGQRDLLLFNNGGHLDSASLYTVWIGSNDVRDAILSVVSGGSPGFADQLVAQSAADLLVTINDLVMAGARDLLIPSVPDLGLIPEMMVLAPSVPGIELLATTLSQDFNDLVDAGLASISAEVTRLDVFTLFRDFIDDPTSLGLPAGVNTTQPCSGGFIGVPGTLCSQPREFVFFDKLHPTAVTHRVLGQLAANAVPVPDIAWLVAIGLLAIGAARRLAVS